MLLHLFFETRRIAAPIFCIFVLIGVCCLGCGDAGETRTVKAYIYGFKVHITEERPALVIVEYTGEVGGCDAVHDPELLWVSGNRFQIRALYDEVDPGGDNCPDYIFEYDKHVILGRLDPGHYTVTINDDVLRFEVSAEPKCQTITWGTESQPLSSLSIREED